MDEAAARGVFRHEIFNPPQLAEPRGWNHGLLAPAGGRILFVAGQTASVRGGGMESEDFAGQFAVALDRVLAVVRAAGGEPAHVGRMTVFVTDLAAYRDALGELAAVWRDRMDGTIRPWRSSRSGGSSKPARGSKSRPPPSSPRKEPSRAAESGIVSL